MKMSSYNSGRVASSSRQGEKLLIQGGNLPPPEETLLTQRGKPLHQGKKLQSQGEQTQTLGVKLLSQGEEPQF